MQSQTLEIVEISPLIKVTKRITKAQKVRLGNMRKYAVRVLPDIPSEDRLLRILLEYVTSLGKEDIKEILTLYGHKVQ